MVDIAYKLVDLEGKVVVEEEMRLLQDNLPMGQILDLVSWELEDIGIARGTGLIVVGNNKMFY